MIGTYTAWELIGFDGTIRSLPENATRSPYTDEDAAWGGPLDRPASVRIKGGHALYESVGNDGGKVVRLARLETPDLFPVIRYVDPDTELEVIEE